MKNKFTSTVKVKLYKIVLTVLILSTGISSYYFYKTQDPKVEALCVGLATGLFIALIQYLLDWNAHAEIEAIKGLGIRRILAHRDDKAFYRSLIDKANQEIWVLGNTASRLLEDFAHPQRGDNRALLEALGRGAIVRILLAKSEHLRAEDRPAWQQAADRMAQIRKENPLFEYRYFEHPPVHSLMKLDSECLVGPIFPKVRSKDSPAIQVDSASPFANEYIKYFEEEWRNAKPI